MNIVWDSSAREFVAEFDDFHGDLEAVKAAGFRTTGPPEWRWHAPSPGIKALNRLRQNRPASGLTISPEALEVYKPLAEIEAKNDAVRKQLAEQKKKVKKEQRESAKCDWLPVGKEYLEASDLPPMPPMERTYVPPPPPDLKCRECNQPIYMYEQQNPPLCLWCEKELDNGLFES
jgi:hypothetical protein